MRFLLLIAHDDRFRGDPELIESIHEWIDARSAEGVRLFGAPLVPADQAVTIRRHAGRLETHEGPFTAGDLHAAAIEMIECENLDEATKIASSHPMAARASIEIRPVWEDLEQR